MRHSGLIPGPAESRREAFAAPSLGLDPIRAVEQAVRAVLGELSRKTGVPSTGVDVFPERLFLLRHAEALPRETRELRVAPGTVITPLALHALKQRGVVVRPVSRAEVDRVRRKGEWGFAVEQESGLVAAFRRGLLDGPDAWVEHGGFTDLCRWLVEAPDRGALLLTDEASVAVWSGCRIDGIRAASAESLDAVDRAVRRLGVNLLAIEPLGKPVALLRQMSSTYRRWGAPRVPDGLFPE